MEHFGTSERGFLRGVVAQGLVSTQLRSVSGEMGSFCAYPAQTNISLTLRDISAPRRATPRGRCAAESRGLLRLREMGSFCAIVISVAPGCTTLHGVALGCVQAVKEFPLAASRIDACRGSTRLDPRSRKRQDTRKTARLLLHPNHA